MDTEKLGRYEIVRVLGKGAMGVVYEGRDPNLDRRVAIKTIRVQSMSPEAAAEYDGRFRTEARSAARLHHPNIVSVFDSGQHDDIAYLVMEFIQGDDLKHHLERGARFSVRAAVIMVHDLLMALDHAHRQNVVHRDIKPANILIEDSGRIKLADFGVARIQDPDEANLTQAGAGAVGTPKYMSPEQAKGMRVDSRSDVFSAGVVLYELLTGIKPFDGDNQFVVINLIVSHTPEPPSQINPEVPAALDEVMVNALAKNPDERYATAREFAAALRNVAQQLPVPAGSAGSDLSDQASTLTAAGADALLASVPGFRDGSTIGVPEVADAGSFGSTVNHQQELEHWNSVKDSLDSKDLSAFLEKFPSGIYARRAKTQLQRLISSQSKWLEATGAGLGSSADPTAPLHGAATLSPSNAGGQATALTRPRTKENPTASALDAASVPGEHGRSAEPGAVAGGRGKVYAAIAAVAVVAIGLFMALRSPQPANPAPVAAALPTEITPVPPLPATVLPASAVVAASTPIKPASQAASAPSATASRPARAASAGASRPAIRVASAALPAVASDSTIKPQQPHAQPAAEEAVVEAPKDKSVGPSASGQVCADKVFISRIACIAEQCNTDRFRHTEECITFKELDRKRADQRRTK